jgi:dolichyl-phosphate-mannose--protein O-mannosyl transferase
MTFFGEKVKFLEKFVKKNEKKYAENKYFSHEDDCKFFFEHTANLGQVDKSNAKFLIL